MGGRKTISLRELRKLKFTNVETFDRHFIKQARRREDNGARIMWLPVHFENGHSEFQIHTKIVINSHKYRSDPKISKILFASKQSTISQQQQQPASSTLLNQ
jgi:hypothetical protein